METTENQNDYNSVTIGGLAGMVQKGFLGVDQRFDKVDQRLYKIEDRLETIEKLLIRDHRIRIERMEEDIKELKNLLTVN